MHTIAAESAGQYWTAARQLGFDTEMGEELIDQSPNTFGR
jgi:hypothetical protein